MIDESILTSTKKKLGILSDYTYFDQDIISYINMAFATLSQLGVCSSAFSISDDTTTWGDFVGLPSIASMAESYVAIKVRTLFDPPTSSVVADALNRQISELEWRMYTEAQGSFYE